MDKMRESLIYSSFADQDLASSKYSIASIKYTRILRCKPQDRDSHYQIAKMLVILRKNKAAEAKTRELLILQPRNVFAYALRGIALNRLKRYKEAEIVLKEARRYGPNQACVLLNLAVVLTNLGKKTEALEACEKVIHKGKPENSVYNIQGYLYFLLGDYEKAVISYDIAIDLAPRECLVYMNKAIVLYLLGKKEEMMGVLEEIKDVALKNEKIDFEEEIEIYRDELERLEKLDCEGEEKQRKACIEGIKFMVNFIESELKAKNL